MKTVFLILSFFSLVSYAQDKTTDDVLSKIVQLEEVKKLGITKQMLEEKLTLSQKEAMLNLDIENEEEVKLLGIQIVKQDNLAKDIDELNKDCVECLKKEFGPAEELKQYVVNTGNIIQKVDKKDNKSGIVLFFTHGYNRGYHSKTDIKVETPHGTYVIKDAVGEDRPSKLSIEYLKPSKFSIPQYNMKLGMWFSRDSKFGLAIGTDHMKWVFDHEKKYDIEGNFDKPIWLDGEQVTFDEIKQTGDMRWFLLEYTDGYNYPYIEGLYRERLVDSGMFQLDMVAAAGFGVLFPKERHRVADRPENAQYRDVDKFHVVGGGLHGELGLTARLTFSERWSVIYNPKVRGVAGFINNARYQENEGRISHTTMWSLQTIPFNIGVEYTLNNRNTRLTKKQAKRLKAMQEAEAIIN